MRTKEQNKEYQKFYRKLKGEKLRKWKREYNKRWRKAHGYKNEALSKLRYPEKEKARSLMNWAIRSGKLTRGDCEVCGKKEAHGHHDNYDKPLNVRWLCPLHHSEVHKNNKHGAKLSDKDIVMYLIKIKKKKIIDEQKREKRYKEFQKLYETMTLQEIGDKYSLSRERVRQILAKYGRK